MALEFCYARTERRPLRKYGHSPCLRPFGLGSFVDSHWVRPKPGSPDQPSPRLGLGRGIQRCPQTPAQPLFLNHIAIAGETHQLRTAELECRSLRKIQAV